VTLALAALAALAEMVGDDTEQPVRDCRQRRRGTIGVLVGVLVGDLVGDWLSTGWW
jgi:hypothetical protein